jgi:hypothetical protein
LFLKYGYVVLTLLPVIDTAFGRIPLLYNQLDPICRACNHNTLSFLQLANFNTIDTVHNLSTAQLEELNSIDIILYLKKESLTHYSADAKLSTSINLISGNRHAL